MSSFDRRLAKLETGIREQASQVCVHLLRDGETEADVREIHDAGPSRSARLICVRFISPGASTTMNGGA
jgi:hypothetical protein